MWVEHWAVWGTEGWVLDCLGGRGRQQTRERQLLAYGHPVSWPKAGNRSPQ